MNADVVIMIKEINEFKEKITSENVYIYGAAKVAGAVFDVLKSMNIDIEGFVVNSRVDNPEEYRGKTVYLTKDISSCRDATIIVATGNKSKKVVADSLLKQGFYKLILLDAELTYDFVRQVAFEMQASFFDSTDYELTIPNGIEGGIRGGMALIADRSDTSAGAWRTELRTWEDLKNNLDRSLLSDKGLTALFEKSWGKYRSIDSVSDTEKSVNLNESLEIFVVSCHKDKPILKKKQSSYMTDIQAGAACTDMRIAECTDDTGDSISNRNRDFSECSAIYWVWKNSQPKEYVGIYHYRRYLDISDASIEKCIEDRVDVINTVPSIIFPTVRDFFINSFVFEHDWDVMLDSIGRLHPDYYADAVAISSGPFYLANNIFIMRREWFDEMCQFVFDILIDIDDMYKDKGFERNDRYAGYLFEVLYGLFVMHHSHELKIAYADMYYLG